MALVKSGEPISNELAQLLSAVVYDNYHESAQFNVLFIFRYMLENGETIDAAILADLLDRYLGHSQESIKDCALAMLGQALQQQIGLTVKLAWIFHPSKISKQSMTHNHLVAIDGLLSIKQLEQVEYR